MGEWAVADGERPTSANPVRARRSAVVGARESHAAQARKVPQAQAHLTVGRADDPQEKEADDIAAQVISHLASAVAQRAPLEDGSRIRRATASGATAPRAPLEDGSRIRRVTPDGGTALRAPVGVGSRIRRANPSAPSDRSIGPEGGDVDPSIERRLASARGNGAALPDGTRARMESAFGADFSGVRVHEGAQPAQLSRELGAMAFTIGGDIFLGDRAPDIARSSGERLLAHELAHTVQQGAASVSRTVQRAETGTESSSVTRVRIRQHADRARVQRKFFGALGTMTDSEIFAAIQQQHPDVPERVQRLITAYRNHKTKRFGSVTDLVAAMDKRTWAQESQEQQAKRHEEVRARVEKQTRRALMEKQQREHLQQEPTSQLTHRRKKQGPSEIEHDLLLSLIRLGARSDQETRGGRDVTSATSGTTGGTEFATEAEMSEPEVDDTTAQYKAIAVILGGDWFKREDALPDETSDKSTLFEHGREKKAMISDSGMAPSTYGTLTAVTTPAFGDPVTGKNVFATSPGEFLSATIDGRPYHLIAGQNFLNTDVSATYKSDGSKIRDGGVKLLRSLRSTGEPGQPEVRFVRDGHHRLIWAAFCHKMAIKVELSEANGQVPFGQDPPTWATMKYQDDPTKAMKDAPPVKELKHKLLREWISQEQPFGRLSRLALQEQDPYSAFVVSALGYHKFKRTPEMTDEIATFIKTIMPTRTKAFFDTMVATLVGRAKDKETAGKIEQFLRSPNLAKTTKTLSICLGPTDSVGFYDTTLHTITLDPVKNPDADALLDTLSFEIQNAAARTKLASANKEANEKIRGQKVVDVEFDSDGKYVESLIQIYGATDLDDLVRNKLKVPSQFLVEAEYELVKRGTGKVEMPDRSVVPRQNAREALWFWKTSKWTRGQQKEIWGGTEHAEGMGASTSTYGDKDK